MNKGHLANYIAASLKQTTKHHKKHRKNHAALTQGEQAGKSSSCAGCPNQSLCASGEAKKKDPALADVQDRLSKVKRKILVLSGGVGMVGVGGEAPMERIHGLVGLGYVFENLEKSQLMMLNFPCYI